MKPIYAIFSFTLILAFSIPPASSQWSESLDGEGQRTGDTSDFDSGFDSTENAAQKSRNKSTPPPGSSPSLAPSPATPSTPVCPPEVGRPASHENILQQAGQVASRYPTSCEDKNYPAEAGSATCSLFRLLVFLEACEHKAFEEMNPGVTPEMVCAELKKVRSQTVKNLIAFASNTQNLGSCM